MTIKNTMLFWNDETREVFVTTHPLRRKLLPDVCGWSDTGAAFTKWHDMRTKDQVEHFLSMAIWASVKNEIPIRNFWDALQEVDECRDSFNAWPF